MEPSERDIEPGDLSREIEAVDGLDRLRRAAASAGLAAYLVGGWVRDLLLGRDRADIDVAVEGSPLAVAEALGAEARFHERFGTATIALDGHTVDLARTRTELYREPGALPEVRPAPLAADLARRDFTVNAIAIPLQGEATLIDPHGGLTDLRAGVLRDLHERSFVDDPTRALRAARYAARLRLAPEPGTMERLRAADLETISADRVEAELLRLASEPDPRPGFELLAEWGLVPLPAGAGEEIDAVVELASAPPWSSVDHRVEAVLAAARGIPVAGELAQTPVTPSDAVRLTRGHTPVELLLARARGSGWLDRYVSDWRSVRLAISGRDLLAAGVAEGPAIGRGLRAALDAKLDGGVRGRDDELRVALAAVRDGAA